MKAETGTASYQSTITDMNGFVLTGGADAAVVEIREGAVGGTVKFTVKAATLVTVPIALPGGCVSQSGAWYVKLVSGTTPQMTISGQ